VQQIASAYGKWKEKGKQRNGIKRKRKKEIKIHRFCRTYLVGIFKSTGITCYLLVIICLARCSVSADISS